jgi:hypothetical protein
MANSRIPKASDKTTGDIYQHLAKARNAVVGKRETQSSAKPEVSKITRRDIITNMADRLSASVYRQLPADKKNQPLRAKLRDTAIELLKTGMEVDAVTEKLHEIFGGF